MVELVRGVAAVDLALRRLQTFGLDTVSSFKQLECERDCERCLQDCAAVKNNALEGTDGKRLAALVAAGGVDDAGRVKLLRRQHTRFVAGAYLRKLPSYMARLDASHPWLLYWTLHSLSLLGVLESLVVKDNGKGRTALHDNIVDFLGRRCQHPSLGGFGGG